MRILVIDDDKLIRKTVLRQLTNKGNFEVFEAASFDAAMGLLQREKIDLAFVDMDLGENGVLSGPRILQEVRKEYPDTVLVMLTGMDDPNLIEQSLKNGASDYIFKPFEPRTLHQVIEKANITHRLFRENRSLRAQLHGIPKSLHFDTKSPAMAETISMAKKLRGKRLSVLITGETGVGKDVMARFLWSIEDDPPRPYVPLNCGAVPATLVESELFGHKKGTFTGATTNRTGKFEQADGGDIFLDEIGTMPLEVQVKLLRTLNDGEVTPIGASISKKCAFRVIAATNENLAKMVKEGSFREDLYFRLKQFTLTIPPLRERKEDIEDLVRTFLCESGHFSKYLPSDALQFCKDYTWPGNIRELRNAIQTAAELTDTDEITSKEIEGQVLESGESEKDPVLPGLRFEPGSFSKSVRDYEKAVVKTALESQGSVSAAARYLGLPRSTLRSKMNEWGWG